MKMVVLLPLLYVLIVILTCVAFHRWHRGARWGYQELALEDLDGIFQEPLLIDVRQYKDDSSEACGGVGFFCFDGSTRITYTQKIERGYAAETLTIEVPNAVGLRLVFVNEEIEEIKRRGERPIRNPELSARTYNQAVDLLRRVRAKVKAYADAQNSAATKK